MKPQSFCIRAHAALAPVALVCGVCVWVLPEPAQADRLEERIGLHGALSVGGRVTLSASETEPLSTAIGWTGSGSSLGARADAAGTAGQAMLWLHGPQASRLSVGIGVEQRGPYRLWFGTRYGLDSPTNSPLTSGTGLLAGLALATGPASHLVLQTPLLSTARVLGDEGVVGGGGSDAAASEPRQLRMGLVFHSNKPAADLRRGMRFELTGQTTLSLRPRGGGRVGLTLQSQW